MTNPDQSVDIDKRKILVVRLGILLFVIGGILRAPSIFLEGRLWAEEGSVFLQTFLAQSFMENLLFLHHGHLHFAVNLVVSAAARLPIIYAPLAITLMSFFVQGAVVYLMLSRVCCFAKSHMVLMVALLFLGIPSTAELWANATNLQWHLALATALIMVTPAPPIASPKGVFILCLLLLSGLTGVPSLFWTPLYLFKATRENDPGRWFQSIILIVSGIVQVSLMLKHGIDGREVGIGFGVFSAAISEQIVISPLLGITVADSLAALFRSLAMGQACSVVVLLMICLVILFYCSYLAAITSLDSLLLMVGCWVSLILGLYGALDDKITLISGSVGGRYFFVPYFTLLLSQIMRCGYNRVMCSAINYYLIISSLTVIFVGYWVPDVYMHGAGWRRQIEVARLGADKEHAIRIWPNGWVIKLDRKHLNR